MHAAAEFVARESNRTSLITVTGVEIGHKAKQATILITVLPETAEADAINFLKRKRADLRDFAGTKVAMRQVPFIDIAIDPGAKHAQKVAEIFQSIK